MPKLLALAAAAAAPCAAFVPQVGLPGPVDVTHQGGQLRGVSLPQEAKSATSTSFVAGMVSIGAAAFATVVAQRKKVARRVSTLELEKMYKKELTEWPDPDVRMSASVPFLKHPKQLDGWVGGEKGFDPLGTTDAIPVYIMREAELKHGRVCMLATIGWIATDLGARLPAEWCQNVSTLQAHDAAVASGNMGWMLGMVGTIEVYSIWLLFKGWGGDIKREAGDFFVGKNFLPKDKKAADEMRLKELENGRLAMLAFSGIVTQAAQFQTKWPFF